MQDWEKALKQTIREMGDEQVAAFTDHPDEVALTLYLDGFGEEAELDRIREHLVWCSDCGRLLDELRQAPGFELGPLAQAPAAKPVPWLHRLSLPLALAASLLMALLLFNRPGPTEVAQNPFEISLAPQTTRAEPGGEMIVPRRADRFELRLNVVLSQLEPAYSLRLTHVGSGHTRSFDEVQPLPGGGFGLSLPRAALTEGIYEVQLLTAATDAPLARYRFSLRFE